MFSEVSPRRQIRRGQNVLDQVAGVLAREMQAVVGASVLVISTDIFRFTFYSPAKL
jgi:hypothetical protein